MAVQKTPYQILVPHKLLQHQIIRALCPEEAGYWLHGTIPSTPIVHPIGRVIPTKDHLAEHTVDRT